MSKNQSKMFWLDIKFAFSLIKKNKLVVLGFIIVLIFIFLAIFGEFLVDPKTPSKIDFKNKLLPPSRDHIFGTDDNGRDIFSLIILGAKYDLFIAVSVISFSILIGIIIGSISGYFGGIVDEIIMRITDIFLAFPGLVLAMAIASVLGRSFTNLMLALIIVWWSSYARVIRGQFISEREKPYVSAAKLLGLSNFRIMFRHILPNTIYPLLILATMDMGGVILTAAGLSFIGLGPSPFEPEWGSLASSGSIYLFQAPWIMFFPGISILLASLGFNLVGDGLRDVLDPRLRR
ncbi:MAG: ABC transporter permease [Nitrososphaeria archaeon]